MTAPMTTPAFIHFSEVEAVIYTEPGFNKKRDKLRGTPSYWYCYVWGSSGIGDNPIQALASACENWVRWNCQPWMEEALQEYLRGKEAQAGVADSVPCSLEDDAGRCSDSADTRPQRGVCLGGLDHRGTPGSAQGAQGHGA